MIGTTALNTKALKTFAHGAAISAAALSMMAGSAHAQKSKDTLRVAVTDSIPGVDGIYFAGFDGFITNKVVQDTLIVWDTVEKKLKPQLATEWKRVDANTIDFKLREGVKFHNGADFTADDVVYTFYIATDPKYKFRLKDRYSFIKNAEKIDKYNVRLHLNKGSGVDLINLSSSPPILPAAIHAKYDNKADFARETIGTGPYRLTALDSVGAVFQKAPTYNWGGSRPAARINRVTFTPIGDKQTQIAKVLVGELDMIYDIDLEQAKQIVGASKDYRLHVAPTAGFFFLNFDTANRSGNSPFGDKRLREAVLAAIDNKALRNAYVPKMDPDQVLSSMCHPLLEPCTPDLPQKLPAYDPAHAKKLLADAGYAKGLDVEILTWSPARQTAEAVAGELRKVGIRATVNNAARNVFTKLRGDGKAVIQVTIWDNGGEPDIERTANYFFGTNIPQNYVQSAELGKIVDQGRDELDMDKRKQIYDRVFEIANAERYISPVIPAPSLIVHHKDVTFDPAPIIYAQGFAFNQMGWVK
jgi:peptide/nickel transport system substrate-binding protein